MSIIDTLQIIVIHFNKNNVYILFDHDPKKINYYYDDDDGLKIEISKIEYFIYKEYLDELNSLKHKYIKQYA